MFPHTKPPVGTQINPLHPLSKGLVGCWLFNEGDGSLANDISGNKNHGRLTNMAPNVQGSGWGGSKFGGGLEFDGVGGYVNCGNSDNLKSTQITICAEIISNDQSDWGHIFGSNYASGAWLALKNDESIAFYTTIGGTTDYWASFAAPLTVGKKYQICAVFNGTVKTIYLDGIYFASSNHSGDLDWSGTTQLRVGASDTDTYHFDGKCSYIYVYNRALSAEESARLHREPYAMFEPSFNPALLYSAAPPVGAIMNQFQKANIGADLYDGCLAV